VTTSATPPSLPPPKGFESWLDYAIATMDVRSAQLESLEDEEGTVPSYEAMRAAAAAELAGLRAKAFT
jgi:hypothetical protein